MNTFFLFSIAAPLMAATGDIAAVRIIKDTCAAGISCNGWVAEIDLEGLSAGGTYAMGLGANNNPSTAKIVFAVASPGYASDTSTTSVTRYVYGVKALRKPYPDASALDESAGTPLTVRVSLAGIPYGYIFSGDTVTVSIASGFYTGSNAVTNLSVTNNSTLAHPKVIANWSQPGWSKISGSSFTVRAVAYHISGMGGKPVVAVKFTATDGTNTVTTVVSNAAVESATYSDYGAVVEYIGTIPTATFAANSQITVNFAAYPAIGDSSAIMDTSASGYSQPTPYPAPIYFMFDGGAYGTSAAVVDASGNDSTCAAVAESAFDSQNPPVACTTINKAASIIAARNSAQYSRNDVAGTIYVKAGNYNWTGASNSISSTTGKSWATITPFPGVEKSSVVINNQSGGQGFGSRCTSGSTNCGTPIHLKGLIVNIATAPSSVFNGITYLWLDDVSLAMDGEAPIYQVTVYYMTKGNAGSVVGGFRDYGYMSSSPALLRAVDFTGTIGGVVAHTVLGSTNTAITSTLHFQSAFSATSVPSLFPILSGNRLYRVSASAGSVIGVFCEPGQVGGAMVQNEVENNGSNSTMALVGISNDGCINPSSNFMIWNNTIVGGRINRGYNDSGAASVIKTLWSESGNIVDHEAIKADTFATQNGNRTGNWSILYGVGRYGVYAAEVNGGAPGFAAACSFELEFGGVSSYLPSNSGQPPQCSSNAVTVTAYKSRAAYDGTSANAGAGDYHLTSASPALNMIPSGGAKLPFDLDGNPRRNDGTGAAGAYESDDSRTRRISGKASFSGGSIK